MKVYSWKTLLAAVFLGGAGLVFSVCMITGCKKQEAVFHMGLNAEVIRVDADNSRLTVKDVDEEAGIFGEKSTLDCSQAVMLYCDYSTGDTMDISLSQLQAGDEVIIGMYDQELKNISEGAAVVNQVQLSTQRMEIK